MIKNFIKHIIFKIRIWYPPDWFVNPFFSPSLYTEYHFRDVPKIIIDTMNETMERLTQRALDLGQAEAKDDNVDVAPSG